MRPFACVAVAAVVLTLVAGSARAQGCSDHSDCSSCAISSSCAWCTVPGSSTGSCLESYLCNSPSLSVTSSSQCACVDGTHASCSSCTSASSECSWCGSTTDSSQNGVGTGSDYCTTTDDALSCEVQTVTTCPATQLTAGGITAIVLFSLCGLCCMISIVSFWIRRARHHHYHAVHDDCVSTPPPASFGQPGYAQPYQPPYSGGYQATPSYNPQSQPIYSQQPTYNPNSYAATQQTPQAAATAATAAPPAYNPAFQAGAAPSEEVN